MAARQLRKQGIGSSRTWRRLREIVVAYNFVRHITSIKIEQVFHEISKELLEHADHMADTITYTAPSPSVEFTAPAPDVTYTESDPVIERAALAPVDVYTKPAPVIELMPADVIEYIAPTPAVSYPSAVSSVDGLNGVVNPQFSITADKTSQMPVQEIPEPHVLERIQEQIVGTISQESVQQRTDEQIVAIAAPRAATASPSPPVSVIEHATLAPVDVYTKPAPVMEPMPAPVIEYIAPSPAVSYPSAFSSVDGLNGVVNPQFSITADETSQMPVQEIIPRAQVVKRIRGKRAHQRTVEQNVRAPVPTVQEQSFVPEKPEAQGVEQMPKSLDRLLGASELEKEEAYWNEFCEDEDNIEQLYQEWLSEAFEPYFMQTDDKRKNWIVRFRFWNGLRNTLWCPLIRRGRSTTSSLNVGPVLTMDDSVICEDTDLNEAAATGRSSRDVYTATCYCFLLEFVVDRLG